MNIIDLTKSENVIELMRKSKSEKEWNDNCDKVKNAHNGQYPDWWYEIIILSGIHSINKTNWI